jgi:hypothetical protein
MSKNKIKPSQGGRIENNAISKIMTFRTATIAVKIARNKAHKAFMLN